jgi:hypothetical protein
VRVCTIEQRFCLEQNFSLRDGPLTCSVAVVEVNCDVSQNESATNGSRPQSPHSAAVTCPTLVGAVAASRLAPRWHVP